jgi:hypothetical protein
LAGAGTSVDEHADWATIALLEFRAVLPDLTGVLFVDFRCLQLAAR